MRKITGLVAINSDYAENCSFAGVLRSSAEDISGAVDNAVGYMYVWYADIETGYPFTKLKLSGSE
ncbi:MAG TPA: hypothetical protein VEG32_14340, partial [Clostridia bacterium]|nr:hypothetical protein [Clostridia bacterium]